MFLGWVQGRDALRTEHSTYSYQSCFLVCFYVDQDMCFAYFIGDNEFQCISVTVLTLT
jgi:hypothetical protein